MPQKKPHSPKLSENQVLILQLMAKGKQRKQIASEMGVSQNSVDTYIKRLLKRLNARSRADLIIYAISTGLIITPVKVWSIGKDKTIMTGLFVRVERDGKFQSVEFENLTEAEVDRLAEEYPRDGWKWARALYIWLTANAHQFVGKKFVTVVAPPHQPPE